MAKATIDKPAKNGKSGVIQFKTHKAVHAKPVQYEDGLVWMEPEELKKIKVARAKVGGYQRELNQRRVDAIAEDLRNKLKSDYPPIEVANIDGVLECFDGQHRLNGHIQAWKAERVHIRSMTRPQAISMFIRDNGMAKALLKREIIAGSNYPLHAEIRAMAEAYKLNQIQVTACIVGVMNKMSCPMKPETQLEERQRHVVDVILSEWTKDNRCIGKTMSDMVSAQERKEFSKTIERSFSSVTTWWALGKIGYDNINNINDLRRDIRILKDQDWKAKNLGSLRTLASDSSNQARRKLYEAMQRILNRELKSRLNQKGK